jgi:phospholipid-translocating ATPase
VWTFALFWYQIYTNFDITYLYDYTYILLVNLAFTSLPVGLMGVLDQDVSDKVSLAVPQLYRRGIERKEWTQTKFWYAVPNVCHEHILIQAGCTCSTDYINR